MSDSPRPLSALSASRPRLVMPPPTVPATTPAPTPQPAPVPAPCYSPPPSLSHSPSSSPSSSTASLHSIPERPNEHLAILLPKPLWKPDSLAARCDNFYCRVPFSLFERRHHCRKCGGVFCASCSSRTTRLLDASKLDFLHPPRNVPLSAFESPTSPILDVRVCDDCWDLLHGNPSTPHSPDLIRPSLSRLLSTPIIMLKTPLSPPASSPPSLSSSIQTPPSIPARRRTTPEPTLRRPRSLRTAPSVSSLDGLPRATVLASHVPLPPDLEKRSYGELDAYPLRHSSVFCKAIGGGRWTPKPDPPIIGYRPPVPGAKACYELELEQQEQEERRRKENPIIRDGDFQYRFQLSPEPPVIAVHSGYPISTF